jgi:hypothetical protein
LLQPLQLLADCGKLCSNMCNISIPAAAVLGSLPTHTLLLLLLQCQGQALQLIDQLCSIWSTLLLLLLLLLLR